MASICKSIHCIFGTIHDHPFFVLKVNPNNLASLASDNLRESLSDMIFSDSSKFIPTDFCSVIEMILSKNDETHLLILTEITVNINEPYIYIGLLHNIIFKHFRDKNLWGFVVLKNYAAGIWVVLAICFLQINTNPLSIRFT